MLYVVIDTNVLVSALLSKHDDSSTVVIRDHILEGTIVPLYNEDIFQEYLNLLHRPKFHIPSDKIDDILDAIARNGMMLDRTRTEEMFPDPKDVVFYEVALTKEGSCLVTVTPSTSQRHPSW